MSFVFISAAEKAAQAAKESVANLLAALNAAGVPVIVNVTDTAPTFRIARKEVTAGYGRWEKTDTVMVFSGKPAANDVATDSKDAGWATAFAPTFRDDDGESCLRGTASQCVVFEFSAAEAISAGVVWND